MEKVYLKSFDNAIFEKDPVLLEKLEDISELASKEFKIEYILDKMHEDW